MNHSTRRRTAAVPATVTPAGAGGSRSTAEPAPGIATPAGTAGATETTDTANTAHAAATACTTDTAPEDTLDIPLPVDFTALHPGVAPSPVRVPGRRSADSGDDLLDRPAGWAPVATSAGAFRLVPVRIGRDLPLISHWMNDPAVAAFWELAGPRSLTEDHLGAQLRGDGRSVPCLGVLGETPMSYWEIYRADLDPLARYYPARPHDTGLHLLIGGVADRGRGLGTLLLKAVADLVLDHRPWCSRVIAEPDLRNTPSVSAFLSAGFRFAAELELPGKRAALMVCDRALRPMLGPVVSDDA
jgi:RimJ/RimL family protein N-acetyltransferase